MLWGMPCSHGALCQAGRLDQEQDWIEGVSGSSVRAWMKAGPTRLGPRKARCWLFSLSLGHLPWSFDTCLPAVHVAMTVPGLKCWGVVMWESWLSDCEQCRGRSESDVLVCRKGKEEKKVHLPVLNN